MNGTPVPFWRRAMTWWSGAWLWFAASPLLFDALVSLARGRGGDTIGGIGGYALLAAAGWFAIADRPRAASLAAGAGAGLAAWLAAGHPPFSAALFALCAAAGGWLLWGEGALVPERPAAPPPPPDPLITDSRARLARVEAASRRLDWGLAARFRAIATEAQGILTEAERDPVDLGRARRFLVVHVEGLARVAELAANGSAPANLVPLLDEMKLAATALHTRLHEADREAAEIQVEVLARRLKEEGLA